MLWKKREGPPRLWSLYGCFGGDAAQHAARHGEKTVAADVVEQRCPSVRLSHELNAPPLFDAVAQCRAAPRGGDTTLKRDTSRNRLQLRCTDSAELCAHARAHDGMRERIDSMLRDIELRDRRQGVRPIDAMLDNCSARRVGARTHTDTSARMDTHAPARDVRGGCSGAMLRSDGMRQHGRHSARHIDMVFERKQLHYNTIDIIFGNDLTDDGCVVDDTGVPNLHPCVDGEFRDNVLWRGDGDHGASEACDTFDFDACNVFLGSHAARFADRAACPRRSGFDGPEFVMMTTEILLTSPTCSDGDASQHAQQHRHASALLMTTELVLDDLVDDEPYRVDVSHSRPNSAQRYGGHAGMLCSTISSADDDSQEQSSDARCSDDDNAAVALARDCAVQPRSEHGTVAQHAAWAAQASVDVFDATPFKASVQRAMTRSCADIRVDKPPLHRMDSAAGSGHGMSVAKVAKLGTLLPDLPTCAPMPPTPRKRRASLRASLFASCFWPPVKSLKTSSVKS